MNICKKIFYRTFQKVMHILIPFFPYREPIVLDEFLDVVDVLKNVHNIENVMIVTDKTIKELGLTLTLETLFKENNIRYTIYDGTVPNPTSDNIMEAKTLYLENECIGIVAIGGGSSIDCAKALGAQIARPNKSLDKMQGLIKIRKRIPLLIAIPTTAGTGSCYGT